MKSILSCAITAIIYVDGWRDRHDLTYKQTCRQTDTMISKILIASQYNLT